MSTALPTDSSPDATSVVDLLQRVRDAVTEVFWEFSTHSAEAYTVEVVDGPEGLMLLVGLVADDALLVPVPTASAGTAAGFICGWVAAQSHPASPDSQA